MMIGVEFDSLFVDVVRCDGSSSAAGGCWLKLLAAVSCESTEVERAAAENLDRPKIAQRFGAPNRTLALKMYESTACTSLMGRSKIVIAYIDTSH